MYNRTPWEEMESIERFMDRMISAFAGGRPDKSCPNGMCGHDTIMNDTPIYDICTQDSAVHVLAEVQGKTAGDIDVTADGKMMTITIRKQSEDEGRDDASLTMHVPLPVPIIPGTVRWNVVHGVLEVSAARDLSTTAQRNV